MSIYYSKHSKHETLTMWECNDICCSVVCQIDLGYMVTGDLDYHLWMFTSLGVNMVGGLSDHISNYKIYNKTIRNLFVFKWKFEVMYDMVDYRNKKMNL